MQIIAHRGASGTAPENTLAAFRVAWELQADGIELDVHLSADHRIMVHHDADTRRTGGSDSVLADTDSQVLRELDVGRWFDARFAGERMPFLEEVLGTVPPHGQVLVEIKCGREIIPPLRQTLAGFPALQDRITLISFDLETIAACRNALPCACCWVVDKDVAYSEQLIEQALTHRLAGLDPNYLGIDRAFAAAVKNAGLRLLCWTVNDAESARRMRDLGLDAITTDYPAEMRQALAL